MEALRKKWSEEEFESHKTAAQKAEWQAQCSALAQLRIGIHACRNSEGLLGNCGSDTRMKFMALGSGVNLTSRLQFLNDYYGTLILISKQTLEGGLGSEAAVESQFITRPVDVLRVSGFESGVTIYEVMDRKMNPAVKVRPFFHPALINLVCLRCAMAYALSSACADPPHISVATLLATSLTTPSFPPHPFLPTPGGGRSAHRSVREVPCEEVGRGDR